MIIKKVNKNIYNKKYLEDRELVWNEKLKEHKNKNIPLWNGSVYYLDEVKNSILNIGLCEYKDLIFAYTKGVEYLKKEYNLNFDFLYMNVQIFIKDRNNRYLFGTKNEEDYTEIISVGGTLRLEDENEIKNFGDIFEYAKKEIAIETKIKINQDQLKYRDMIINNNICTFLFDYKIDVIGEDVLKIGEFDGYVLLDKEDIFNESKFKANDRLKSLQDFL